MVNSGSSSLNVGLILFTILCFLLVFPTESSDWKELQHRNTIRSDASILDDGVKVAEKPMTTRREDRQKHRRLKKALRKKRKRLRQLRDDVRSLREIINGFTNKSHVESEHAAMSRKAPTRKSKLLRFRRRVMKELRALSLRIRTLEEDNGIQPTAQKRMLKKEVEKRERKKKRRKNRRKNNRQLRNATEIDTGILVSAKREHRMHLFNSAVNNSMRGTAGGSCQSHGDCKPGLCCHRRAEIDSVCSLHDLFAGSDCADSCQCRNGLHCFQATSVHEDPANDSSKQRGKCKKATTDDILQGTYLNDKNSVFEKDAFG